MSASPSDAGLPARRVACRVLDEIFFRHRSLDEVFAQTGRLDTLVARDRAFVRLLVSVALKRAGEIDAVLQKFLNTPLSDLNPPGLLNILRLGVVQYAFLKTPPHAAVDTTVSLAPARARSLVNAVMRRLTREGFVQMDPREAGPINTPPWLWAEWERDYGAGLAAGIAAANLAEAPLDISVKENQEQWAQALDAEILPTGSLRRQAGGLVTDLPGFTQGEWWIQNAAAALPAKIFPDLRGKTVIDLCAAPGGKTAQLAAMGARVTAVDRSAGRLRRLQENMERLRLDVAVVAADGAEWRPDAPVDAVLLDAPCTATGTLRHQPDVLHLKKISDQEKMVALQRCLLTNAVEMLKPGGVLVYCTCSLQHAEGELQTDWLLAQNLPVRLSPISAGDIQGVSDMITARGEIRCLPCHGEDKGGMDGFYVVRFVKS